MSKFQNYPPGSGVAIATLDLILMAKAASSFETQKFTIEEFQKYFATVTALAAAATGSFTFAQSATPSATASGETWLDTDDGKVYVSSGTGTGNWGTFVYQLVLNSNSTTLDRAGGESVRDQTILNMNAGKPAFYFDGLSGDIFIADNAKYAELFENGGTYVCYFNAFSAGSTGLAGFFAKGTSLIFLSGVWRLQVPFSGGSAEWRSTGTSIPINKDSIACLTYSGSNVSNVPLLEVDGVDVPLFEEVAPVGTISTDVGTDLYFGNSAAGSRDFHGNHYFDYFLNREVTAAEAKSISSNPQKAIEFADQYGSNVDLTSGTVEIGKNYRTTDFIAGDDFTNVSSTGASANVDGAEWTAIATTPTTWTNSSILHKTGATLVIRPEDASPEIVVDRANQLPGVVNTELTNRDPNKIHRDPYAVVADNDQIPVPAGTAFLEIWINVITLEAATTIRIGTADGGEQVVADSAAPTIAGLQKLTVLISKFAAADILYIGTDGGAWSTVVADIYVRYQIIDGIA